jgi:hypothetical protein
VRAPLIPRRTKISSAATGMRVLVSIAVFPAGLLTRSVTQSPCPTLNPRFLRFFAGWLPASPPAHGRRAMTHGISEAVLH